jgi:hypothetical protein
VKPYLRFLLNEVEDPLLGRHLVREYLQARMLESLQRAGAMIPLAFHGGTALRFLYGIPRYSEDLDFSLERQAEQYDFRRYLQMIERDFVAEGYQLSVKYSEQRVVNSALIRFQGLLHELGLTPHVGEILAIKVEVDTRPPAGATLATTVVNRHVRLHLQHHDPASLLAGKVIALLQRSYAKGRDYYDLAWYLSQPGWPEPNLVMLQSALAAADQQATPNAEINWCQRLLDRLPLTNWDQVVADVAPFVMDDSLAIMDRELIRQRLLQRCGD